MRKNLGVRNKNKFKLQNLKNSRPISSPKFEGHFAIIPNLWTDMRCGWYFRNYILNSIFYFHFLLRFLTFSLTQPTTSWFVFYVFLLSIFSLFFLSIFNGRLFKFEIMVCNDGVHIYYPFYFFLFFSFFIFIQFSKNDMRNIVFFYEHDYSVYTTIYKFNSNSGKI